MNSPVALVREPSASLAACELSFLERSPIDLVRARVQHRTYCAALGEAGAQVTVLPALDDLPDAVFVEDTAVVVDEVAIVAAPGAASRAAESDAIVAALSALRPVRRLGVAGATLEGGDVLRMGRTLYVGRSRRTNDAGIAALRTLLEPLGYRVTPVPVHACLHLKTACSAAGERTVLLNPSWIDGEVFRRDGLEVISVATDEPWAANVLRIGKTLLTSAGHPSTRARLRAAGLEAVEVDIGELRKAEAGLTCLSILVPETLSRRAG